MNAYYGWGEYSDLPSTKINTEMVFIKNELEIEFYHGTKDNILEHIIINNIILKSLENRFSNYNLFTKNKPNKIINKTPYIIG
jgi:U3 small nucleolar RNA-associated protein 14